MYRRSLRFVILFLVVTLVLVACGGAVPAEETPADEDAALAEPEDEAEVLVAPQEEADEEEEAISIEAGPITRNAEWEPIIREFNGVPMALVPAGCFMMGSDDGDAAEQPIHEVCFEEPFWIDVYEVTNAQFGSAASNCMQWSSSDGQPHICVNWYLIYRTLRSTWCAPAYRS